MNNERITLDYRTPGLREEELLTIIRRRMIGQDRAVRLVTRQFIHATAHGGLFRNPEKPAGQVLFLGPTGTGKTLLMRIVAEILTGSLDGMTKIDCPEIHESHDLSRLIGAPHGYLGFDVEPYLTQRQLDHHGFMAQQNDPEFITAITETKAALDATHTELRAFHDEMVKLKSVRDANALVRIEQIKLDVRPLIERQNKLNQNYNDLLAAKDYRPGSYPIVLLFDEIERADPAIFQILLQILDTARLTVNYSPDAHDPRAKDKKGVQEVLFHNAIIGFTSNIGEGEIKNILRGSKQMGFAASTRTEQDLDQQIFHTVLEEVEKHIKSPAFLGRLGKENIVVFSPLTKEEVARGLNEMIIPRFVDAMRASDLALAIEFTERVRA